MVSLHMCLIILLTAPIISGFLVLKSDSLWTHSLLVGSSSTGPRTTTFDVYYGEQLNVKPENSLIAINGYLFQGNIFEVDLSILTSTSSKVIVDINVLDGTQLMGLCYSILQYTTDELHKIDIDFGLQDDFVKLSTGTIDDLLDITIPYTPSNADLFSNPKAFLTFYSIYFDPTSTILHMESEIVSVTSTEVRVVIRKFSNCRILRLKGTIVIVSDLAADTYGFSSEVMNLDPFNFNSGTPIGSRTDYQGAPVPFIALSSIKSSPLQVGIYMSHTMGLVADKPFLQIGIESHTGAVTYKAGYQVLLFCKRYNECLIPKNDLITTGTVDVTLTKDLPGALNNGERNALIISAFDSFLTTTPQYFAIGFTRVFCSQGISVEKAAIDSKTVSLLFLARNGNSIYYAIAKYFASNWKGLQSHFVDFSQHINFVHTPPASPPTRTLDYEIPFDVSPELGNNIKAFVLFTEYQVLTGGTVFDEDFVSSNSTHVIMRITIPNTVSISYLRGYVVVYNANSIGYRIESMILDLSDLGTGNMKYAPMNNRYINKPSFIFGTTYLIASSNPVSYIGYLHQIYTDQAQCQSILHYQPEPTIGLVSVIEFTALVFYTKPMEISVDFFVYRVIGFVNSALSQVMCLEGNFDAGDKYVLMITDESTIDNVPNFQSPIRKVPRIIRAVLLDVPSNFYLKVTVEPFQLAQSGDISLHLFKVTAQDENHWNYKGFHSADFDSFPFKGDFTNDLASGDFNYTSTLPKKLEAYTTITASQIYSHNWNEAFSCRIRLAYKGILRSLFVNSELILGGSTLNSKIEIIFESSIQAVFNPGELVYITSIGYHLTIKSLEFFECRDLDSSSLINPEFTLFIKPSAVKVNRIDLFYESTGINCPSGCLSCLSDTYCLKCEEGKYLLMGICQDICTTPNMKIPLKNSFCDSQQRSFAIRNNEPTYQSALQKLNIDYQVTPYSLIEDLIIMYLPFDLTYTNYPAVIQSEIYNEGEIMYSIHRIEPTEKMFRLTYDQEIKVAKDAGSQKYKLISYSLVKEKLLFVELDPGTPGIASAVLYQDASSPINIDAFSMIKIDFIVKCSGICSLTIEFKGSIEAMYNEKIVLATESATIIQNEIVSELTMISHLTFTLQDSDYFGYLITGEYEIYSLKDFLFEDKFEIKDTEPGSDCVEKCFTDEDEKKLANSVKSLASSFSTAGIASAGLLLLTSSNPTFAWFLISILQKYYYLIYINVEYPYNLEFFLSAFKIATLDFIPNAPQLINLDSETNTLPSPGKFKENDVNGLFLSSSGSIISIWIFLIVYYFCLKLAIYYRKYLPKKIIRYVRKVKTRLIWSGILRNWMTTYMELCISGFLQLLVLKWDTGSYAVSSLLGFTFIIFNILFPICTYALILRLENLPSMRVSRRFQTLFEELKDSPRYCKMYNVVWLARRLLTSLALVMFQDIPSLQISFLILVDGAHLVYLMMFKPYQGKSEQLSVSIDDTIYFIIFLIIGFLQIANTNEIKLDSKIGLGWGVIGFCMTGLIVTFVFLLANLYHTFKKLYTKYFKKNKLKTRQVVRKNIKKVKVLDTRKVKMEERT